MGYHVLQIYQSRRVYQNQQQTQAIIYYSDFFYCTVLLHSCRPDDF